MKLKRLKLQISCQISPQYFQDPEDTINNQLSSYLFKYSYKLQGIPLCYRILGIYPIGSIIQDNPSIYLLVIVEYDIYFLKIGDLIYVEEGTLLGVVGVQVDDKEAYTGQIKVMYIETSLMDATCIIGEYVS